LVDEGGCVVKPCDAPDVLLVAIGAYQLQQALLAARRLEAAGHRTAVTCVIEPGRFRHATNASRTLWRATRPCALFPDTAAMRVIVSHMRPEPTLGLLRRIDTGPRQTRALGYQARGGTLDVAGMLFANRCTWAHVAAEAAQGLGVDPQSLLSAEWAAVQGVATRASSRSRLNPFQHDPRPCADCADALCSCMCVARSHWVRMSDEWLWDRWPRRA
jgi:phosphoketolase